jgi:hypothetical protein
MSKKKVIVQSRHVIFDDKGQSLIPAHQHTVEDGPVVDAHILNGLLTIVTETKPEATKAEVMEESKKIVQNKNPRTQETETLIPQENANG